MVLRRSAQYFTRWRQKCLPPPMHAIPRVWSTRIALGVSASIYLATLNNMHGDSEETSSPSSGMPPAVDAGFMVDPSQWHQAIRIFGEELPEGVLRISYQTRTDARIRTMSNRSRLLISILEGDLVNETNVADTVEENLWSDLENFFGWYQIDHSSPQPVELMHESQTPSPQGVHSVVQGTIAFADDHIVNSLRATSSGRLVSALYDENTNLLHVVTLGNMLGVLGRPREADDGSVKYDVHVLSVDHTPNNPAEKSRIERLHPGETVIENGALFGRPYTRAFGDGKLKWSNDVQSRVHTDYLVPTPDPSVKTPPYISAEPDMTTIKVLPGDFLVLSTRCLAECLTDEEVVGLIGVWLNEGNMDIDPNQLPAPSPTLPKVIMPQELPVDLKEDKTVWNVPKHFVNGDVNPATHLAINAFGGANSELKQPPFESEGNTKPLGIVVVFFQ
ncbi:phosphatase 2C-domain-containing protein [Mycena capillaripes]|nr:phosphatase 2C-domain-containing protein [Mycena capillaripes]